VFCHNKEHLCNRIDATTLIDRTNEGMQESKDEIHATQANITEDSNQCSEEPKALFGLGRQESVHLIPIF